MRVIHPKRIRHQFRRWLLYERYPFGAILMLHRVSDINADRIWYNEHLKLSPGFLDAFIKDAVRNGFSFVSMDELSDIIRRKKRAKKILSITLDDGYKDNYTDGLPVFKNNNVPFCIFVATKMIERQMIYWWYILEDLILSNDVVTLDDGRVFNCKTKKDKEQAFLEIRETILERPQDNIGEELKKMFCHYLIKFDSYNEILPLTWDELKLLNDEPLATIGCHTHSHLSFAGCTDEKIKFDIELSKNLMRDKVKIEMKHFAYPFGDDCAVSRHHKEIVRNCGFDTICTTDDGIVGYDTDLLELPRLFVTERNAVDILNRISHEL